MDIFIDHVDLSITHRTKMGPQRRLGIYVSFDFPFIIRYLEPLMGDVFTVCFTNCHFNESVFPQLGVKSQLQKNDEKLLGIHLQCPILILVQFNVNWKFKGSFILQNLANQLPYAFIDTKKVTKSHILAANAQT